MIPLTAFNLGQNYELDTIAKDFIKMSPMYCSGFNPRYNFDGFLTYCGLMEGKSNSYVQLFKNGIIEAVSTELLNNEKKQVLRGFHEKEIIKSIYIYLDVYKELNIETPIFISLALLGVNGYSMLPKVGERPTPFDEDYVIERDNLIIPGVMLENYEDKIEKKLKPCFDSIWNACGYSESENYDKNGEWKPK